MPLAAASQPDHPSVVVVWPAMVTTPRVCTRRQWLPSGASAQCSTASPPGMAWCTALGDADSTPPMCVKAPGTPSFTVPTHIALS